LSLDFPGQRRSGIAFEDTVVTDSVDIGGVDCSTEWSARKHPAARCTKASLLGIVLTEETIQVKENGSNWQEPAGMLEYVE
jgi:hypothetical protein